MRFGDRWRATRGDCRLKGGEGSEWTDGREKDDRPRAHHRLKDAGAAKSHTASRYRISPTTSMTSDGRNAASTLARSSPTCRRAW